MLSRCIFYSSFLQYAKKNLIQKQPISSTTRKFSRFFSVSSSSFFGSNNKNVLLPPRSCYYQPSRNLGGHGEEKDDMLKWSIKKGDLDLIGKKAKDMSNNEMIQILARCIWPKGDTKEKQDIRKRVTLCMGLMLGGRIVNTSIPFILRYVVDGFNTWETIGRVYSGFKLFLYMTLLVL